MLRDDKQKDKIHPVVIDVRSPHNRKRPNIKKRPAAGFFSRGGFLPKAAPKRRRFKFKILRRVLLYCIGSATVITAAYGLFLWNYSGEAVKAAHLIYDNLKNAIVDISSLKTDSAGNSLNKADSELDGLQNRTAPLSIAPYLKNIPGALSDVKDITSKLISINASIGDLRKNGFGSIFKNGDVLATMKKIDADMIDLERIVKSFNAHVTPFYGVLGLNEGYLKAATELMSYREGLESVIGIIERAVDIHLLVLFQNPSEIRPAGGFTGSYADLVLRDGVVKEINVNDIYYPEHFLKARIVPPFQLQGITRHWGPQDANWFFDFPASARKVAELMEKSSVYAEKNTKFDGVISINIRLIEDFLRLTGPIEVPSYGHTLNADNFMRVVQEEVEEGRDKIPGQNPKRILNVITPILIEKLTNLDESHKSELINIFKHRFEDKDMQFYFKDSKFEDLMKKWGGGGEVFQMPADFTGDYLAVVNANIAGGKTDAVISQGIDLNSIIEEDGRVSDILTIERIHHGDGEKEPRYRAFDNNFIKIFTPLGASLIDLKGHTEKIVNPVLNYKNLNYAVDADLYAIERTKSVFDNFNASTYIEAGKNVFATWFSIAAGESKKLSVVYESATRIVVAPGHKYEFVFDKQSGVESRFKYTLKAPPGFIWRETGSPTFSYETNNLPSRVKFGFTLDKEAAVR